MHRRSFLTSAGGLAVYGLPRLVYSRERQLRVGVVGGGIIGASIAYHLARAGAQVNLFEKIRPAAGATEKSLAWINPMVVNKDYMALRLESMLAWRKLNQPLDLRVIWGGAISWTNHRERAEHVKARALALEGTADAPRILDAQSFASISPAVMPGPIAAGFFAPADGQVDPVWATHRFLHHAERLGAKIRFPCEVQAIDFRAGQLAGVTTNRGKFPLDRLIIASGIDTPHLLSMVGYGFRLQYSPRLMAHSLPLEELSRIVYEVSGELEFKQMGSGRIAATFEFGPPDIAVHREIREHPIDFPSADIRKMHGEMLLSKVSGFMPGARNAALDKVMLCFRPLPLDGLPVVGTVPGTPDVYMVVTHSGVTLAPVLGHYATHEVLSGKTVARLAPYRPDRFSEKPLPNRERPLSSSGEAQGSS